MKKIIYCETAGYDLIIAIDDDDAVRYTGDTLLDVLERETGRNIFGLDRPARAQAVFDALSDPDADISGWALADDDGLTLDDLLSPAWSYNCPDGVRVVAETEVR